MKNRVAGLIILSILLSSANGWSQIIRTIAGTGAQTYTGNHGPAIMAGIGNPNGVTVDAAGNVYMSDFYFNNVRKISGNGIITTYTGDTTYGIGGFTGNDGPASLARINSPFQIVTDNRGIMYLDDGGNYLIRKLQLDSISYIAGIPNNFGGTGDGGPATNAKIGATGIGIDRYNNVYIADGNTRVRKVNISTGIITTVAGTSAVGYGGNGGQATAATLDGPSGVCFDTAGNMYIADRNNSVIRKVNATTGIITHFAGVTSSSSTTPGYSGDGGQASSAKISSPASVRIAPNGDIVIVDNGNNKIRSVNLSTGIIRTIVGASTSGGFAGDGGPATAALISFPTDVAFDRWGNMFIADKGSNTSTSGHRIREVFFVDTLHIAVSPSDTICGYARTTFTAIERKGRHYWSFFRWKLNGNPVGTNSRTYVLDTAHNGDVITCSIVDTASGGFTIAVSDTVRLIVRPVIVPAISLTSSIDTICSGALDTITAHVTNGGTSPTYQWYLFDTLLAGATNTTYSYTPRVGDIIKCRLTSNAICAYPSVITATLPMVVVPGYPPDITLRFSASGSTDTVISYWGQWVNVFSNLTYEGTHPRFQWFKNGTRISGATGNYYMDEVYSNDTIFAVMYSNAPCVVPDHDTSNVVHIRTGVLGTGSAASSHGNLSLAPNPNNGSFVVTGKFGNIGIRSARLTVTDMMGKIVHQSEQTVQNGELSAKIEPVHPFADGMYMLTVRHDSGSEVLRFMVISNQ